MRSTIWLAVAATALAAASAAPAQDGTGAAARGETTWVDIQNWDSAYLYDGWSVDELLDEPVFGTGGTSLGTIADLVIGSDGMIRTVLVKSADELEVGGRHIALPWDRVTRVGTGSVTATVSGAEAADLPLLDGAGALPDRPETFRVRELLGDFARADGTAFGMIADAIFSVDGKIEAVIVEPAHGRDYRLDPTALPYSSDAYDPYQPYYDVPYGSEQLRDLRPFDYDELG